MKSPVPAPATPTPSAPALSAPAPSAPISRRAAKRARLARLRDETEPLVAEERRAALRALLQQPLLTPDGPRAGDYVLVRRHREWLANWFAHHAGWPLVVTPEAARLRKFTTLTTDTTRLALEPRNGEPFTRTRYTLLCLALSTLERGDRQITLRRLSEYLLTAATLETRLHALTDPARPDTPEARNRAHRTTLIARLLDDPVLYYDTLADDEKTYLDYQRSSILDTLAEATALHLEVRAEGIALADLEGDCTDAGLPEEGTEGHLTLLVATWLADRLRAGDATPLSLESIQAKIANLIRRHTHHWRK